MPLSPLPLSRALCALPPSPTGNTPAHRLAAPAAAGAASRWAGVLRWWWRWCRRRLIWVSRTW